METMANLSSFLHWLNRELVSGEDAAGQSKQMQARGASAAGAVSDEGALGKLK